MTHVAVHVWAASVVDQGFVDSAISAIDSMDSQLDFSMYSFEEDQDFDYPAGTTNWGQIKDDFIPYVEDKEGGAPDDYECHLVIVDDLWPGIGAGKAWGLTNRTLTPFSSGKAAACGVNAALKFYVNNNCQGSGSKAFENTVKHEILHTMLGGHLGFNSFPESGNEHSLGSVYLNQDGGDDWVSPMQTWYSENNCGDGNPDVADNCNDYYNVTREGYDGTLSDCTVQEVEDYYDNTSF